MGLLARNALTLIRTFCFSTWLDCCILLLLLKLDICASTSDLWVSPRRVYTCVHKISNQAGLLRELLQGMDVLYDALSPLSQLRALHVINKALPYKTVTEGHGKQKFKPLQGSTELLNTVLEASSGMTKLQTLELVDQFSMATISRWSLMSVLSLYSYQQWAYNKEDPIEILFWCLLMHVYRMPQSLIPSAIQESKAPWTNMLAQDKMKVWSKF